MQVEPTITFRRIRTPAALETDIRNRLARLEKFCPSIIGAHVALEMAERRHQRGNHWRLRIELVVPGERIVVTNDVSLRPELRARAVERTHKQDEPDAGHKYAKVAVREGFEVARRQVQDFVRRQRGEVKSHGPTRRRPVAQVRRRS